MKARKDDFEDRSKHLKALNDQELKSYFFELTDQLLEPIMEMAYDYTSPAIERSVLMRMGFSSIEAKAITENLFENNLLEYGAGHLIYIYAKSHNLTIREAGLELLSGKGIAMIKEVFNND